MTPPPRGEGWVGARHLRQQMTPTKKSLRSQTRPAPHHARGWMSGEHPQPCPPGQGCLVHSPTRGEGLTPHDLTALADRLRSDPDALAEFIERVSPPQERGDGWSPAA